MLSATFWSRHQQSAAAPNKQPRTPRFKHTNNQLIDIAAAVDARSQSTSRTQTSPPNSAKFKRRKRDLLALAPPLNRGATEPPAAAAALLQFPHQAAVALYDPNQPLCSNSVRTEGVLSLYEHGLSQGSRDKNNTAVFGRSGYHTFMVQQGAPPWPVTLVAITHWLYWATIEHRTASTGKPISFASANRYLSALRDLHIDRDLPWLSVGQLNVLARFKKGMRMVVKEPEPYLKMAITPTIFEIFLALADLSQHDNRVALAATSLGIQRARRGGEFCSPDILRRNWKLHSDRTSADLVRERGVKTRPYLRQSCTTFYAMTGLKSCPITRVQDYLAKSTQPLPLNGPLFVLANGRPLTIEWLKQWTTLMLLQADIKAQGKVVAASWRAGQASASIALHQPAMVTKKLGDWASDAYMSYACNGPKLVQNASLQTALDGSRQAKAFLSRRQSTTSSRKVEPLINTMDQTLVLEGQHRPLEVNWH